MLDALCNAGDVGGLGDPFSPDRSWPPVPRLWPGERAVILAGGPSLTPDQISRVQEAHSAQAARVIAVNNCYQIAPWADLLYACDGAWWRKYKDARAFQGLKVTQDPSVAGILRVPSEDEDGLSLDPLRIHQGANGGYQAINLAVLLGVREIILLGFDMRASGTRRHWHPDHPLGMNNPNATNFAGWLARFDSVPPDLERAGVRVINCSPGSALTAFPAATLEDAL
jgi:hypothetical protein